MVRPAGQVAFPSPAGSTAPLGTSTDVIAGMSTLDEFPLLDPPVDGWFAHPARNSATDAATAAPIVTFFRNIFCLSTFQFVANAAFLPRRTTNRCAETTVRATKCHTIPCLDLHDRNQNVPWLHTAEHRG